LWEDLLNCTSMALINHLPMSPKILFAPSRLAAALGLLLISSSVEAQVSRLTRLDINNPVEGLLENNPDGSITVTAGGNDTWGNSDSFTFLYEEKTGDFDLKVEILDLQVDDAREQDSAKASLHARADLDPDSANVMINGTPIAEGAANYIETIYRPSKGGGTDDPPIHAFFPKIGLGPWDGTYRPVGDRKLYAPAEGYSTWLRMRRVGNTIQTYVGVNGVDWEVLADYTLNPEQFSDTLYVGLSTVAHLGPNENQEHRVRARYANYGDVATPVPTLDGTTPVDPSAGPGVYPVAGVTAANWKLAIPEDGKAPNGDFIKINSSNKNQLILTVEGQGPVSWSAPGYNQGDLDISLSPRDPAAALRNQGPYSNPDRAISVVDPNSPVTQAWIPSTRHGLVLATVRKNSQQWNDDGAGGATPPFSAFASVSVDFSSRKGFSMDNGRFVNGEIYVSIFKIGEAEPRLPAGASPLALREANIDVATAWFPFVQGWKAGYFHDATKAPAAHWAKHASHSGSVTDGTTSIDKVASKALMKWADADGNPEDGVFTAGGLGRLTLAGVDSLADGMLFAVSNDDSSDNEGQIVSVVPVPADDASPSGWTIAIRQDDGNYDPTVFSDAARSEFGFVFIPYTAGNLVGGHVKGSAGSKINGAGDYSIRRLAAGRYELTLPGETGTTGMLLLQNAGVHPSDPALADDSALSYEYAGGNTFIVESHSVVPGGSDTIATRDTDFYFAWVDFTNPLTPSPAPAISLEAAAKVEGPYAADGGAIVDTTARTITVAKNNGARFYRARGDAALKLKSIRIQGNNVIIAYE